MSLKLEVLKKELGSMNAAIDELVQKIGHAQAQLASIEILRDAVADAISAIPPVAEEQLELPFPEPVETVAFPTHGVN